MDVEESVGLHSYSFSSSARNLKFKSGSKYTSTRNLPVSQAIMITDNNFRIISVNQQLLSFTDLKDPQALVSTSAAEIFISPYKEKLEKWLHCKGKKLNDTQEYFSPWASGKVVRIRSNLNHEGISVSLWLKPQKDEKDLIFIWVLQEIKEDVVHFELTMTGFFVSPIQDKIPLFKYTDEAYAHLHVTQLIPNFQCLYSDLSKGISPTIDVEKLKSCKHFGCVSGNGVCFPATLSQIRRIESDPPFSNDGKLKSSHITFNLFSMNDIAGVILTHSDGTIYSCNSQFSQYLFGYTANELLSRNEFDPASKQPNALGSFHISILLPQYFAMVEKFEVLYKKHLKKWGRVKTNYRESQMSEVPPAYASFRSYPKPGNLKKTKPLYEVTESKLRGPACHNSISTGILLKSVGSPILETTVDFEAKKAEPIKGELSCDETTDDENTPSRGKGGRYRKGGKAKVLTPILARHKDGTYFWVDVQMKRVEKLQKSEFNSKKHVGEQNVNSFEFFYSIWITFDRTKCFQNASPSDPLAASQSSKCHEMPIIFKKESLVKEDYKKNSESRIVLPVIQLPENTGESSTKQEQCNNVPVRKMSNAYLSPIEAGIRYDSDHSESNDDNASTRSLASSRDLSTEHSSISLFTSNEEKDCSEERKTSDRQEPGFNSPPRASGRSITQLLPSLRKGSFDFASSFKSTTATLSGLTLKQSDENNIAIKKSVNPQLSPSMNIPSSRLSEKTNRSNSFSHVPFTANACDTPFWLNDPISASHKMASLKLSLQKVLNKEGRAKSFNSEETFWTDPHITKLVNSSKSSYHQQDQECRPREIHITSVTSLESKKPEESADYFLISPSISDEKENYSEPTTEENPSVITDYVVESHLGEGAYGFVKLAKRRIGKQERKRERVVVKYIYKSKILDTCWTDHSSFGKITIEIEVMLKLQEHPHRSLVELAHFFEDQNYFYLEMPLHGKGMDLFEYIDQHQSMSEDETKSIFLQVVQGIQHLHHMGIVHRDIKDENIIIDDKTIQIKIIDFGSSAYYKLGESFQHFSGTVDYAAPEILVGRLYEGPPQDVWALGVLLYIMLYKENPFFGSDDIIHGDLQFPFVLYPGGVQLVKSILERSIPQRPTIDNILEHPWLKMDENDAD